MVQMWGLGKKNKKQKIEKMNIKGIQEYTEELIKQEGVVSLTILSAEDGTVLMYKSENSDIDNQLAASFQIEVLRQISRGLNYIDELEDKEIQNLTVDLNEQTHFVFTSELNEVIVHLVVDNEKSNAGIIKLLHKKHRVLLEE